MLVFSYAARFTAAPYVSAYDKGFYHQLALRTGGGSVITAYIRGLAGGNPYYDQEQYPASQPNRP